MTTTQIIRLLCISGSDFTLFQIRSTQYVRPEKVILQLLEIQDFWPKSNPLIWQISTEGSKMLIHYE